jgi:hypothetical protein
MLILVADNDYDRDGEALADEFSDTVAAYAPGTPAPGYRVRQINLRCGRHFPWRLRSADESTRFHFSGPAPDAGPNPERGTGLRSVDCVNSDHLALPWLFDRDHQTGLPRAQWNSSELPAGTSVDNQRGRHPLATQAGSRADGPPNRPLSFAEPASVPHPQRIWVLHVPFEHSISPASAKPVKISILCVSQDSAAAPARAASSANAVGAAVLNSRAVADSARGLAPA